MSKTVMAAGRRSFTPAISRAKVSILFLAAGLLWPGAAESTLPAGRPAHPLRAYVEESSSAFDVVLTLVRPAFPNGLGMAVTFDSRRLRFREAGDLFLEGLVSASASTERDASDIDGNPATDALVRLAWIAPAGDWASDAGAKVLAQLRFQKVESGRPAVTIVPLSAEPAHRFQPLRLSGLTFEETLDYPQVRFEPSRPGASAATTLPCSPDADGNGRIDALTDGVLIVRYLMGLTDEALVSGAVGAGATRASGAQVASFLANSDCLPMLDADANGQRDALTDGILIARWLFGFTGEALVKGAIGSGAKRAEPGSISSQLVFYSNPREPVIEAALKVGETAQDASGQFRVKAVDAATTVTVIGGINEEGSKTFDFKASAPATLEVTLPPASSMGATSSQVGPNPYAIGESSYYTWGSTKWKWFAGTPFPNRLPESRQDGIVSIGWCLLSQGVDFTLMPLRASRLRSLCAETDTACYKGGDGKGKDAILFIHGFSEFGLGDGTETFKEFPLLMRSVGNPAFIFDWNTSARFEDVAGDLGDAIVRIASSTGRQVHIVAHSMGGILARTLLQGMASSDQAQARGLVRTLTTFGTPHSGIADRALCLHGTGLPGGQDPSATFLAIQIFEGCQQISCHELGEDTLNDQCEPLFFGVDAQEGGLVARLKSTVQELPSLDVLSLLGWTIDSTWTGSSPPQPNSPNYFSRGDGLITYEGQRFLPSLTVSGSCPNVALKALPDALLDQARYGQAKVTERALGFAEHIDPIPGSLTGFHCQSGKRGGGAWSGCASWQAGYGHTDLAKGLATVLEADPNCSACLHNGYTSVWNWIRSRPAEAAPSLPDITTFTASPAVIAPGQSSTLSWASTGGTSASIDSGVGSVATSGTKTVSPAQTTTYALTVTGSGGNTTKHATVTVGTQSGSITNGGRHAGVIPVGGSDTWTIQATQNDSISVSIGEVLGSGPDPYFNPWIRLKGPDGTLLGDNSGSNAAQIDVRAPLTGIYTVLVANRESWYVQAGPGSYLLTVAKSPGQYTISSGDEGGPLANGAVGSGTIEVGDLDPWTIQANYNDSITVSVGEVLRAGTDPAFNPWIRLRGPDGTLLGDNSGSNAAQIDVRAPLTGTYTVLVANREGWSIQAAPGSYVLSVAKSPGPFTVSSGDEGGPLTNGTTYSGTIEIGGLDPWTIQANYNDSITVSVGEVLGAGPDVIFNPWVRLRGPDGALLGDNSGSNAAQIDVRAPLTGTYTVLVANREGWSVQAAPGSYVLSVAKSPGPYTVSSGDEGGPLNNGTTYSGTIEIGGLDPWTIQANYNDSITISVGEVLDAGPDVIFNPWIRLRGPDGALLGDNSGSNAAQIDVRAPLTGTYTVLVANREGWNAQTGPGSYVLSVAKSPGPYTVSSGDEGGPLTNGASHSGTIEIGGLDPWTIQANYNDSITISVGEILGAGPDVIFNPWIRLRGPDGTLLGDTSGSKSAQIDVRAPLTGTYTVLVANREGWNAQTGPGSYVLTVAKSPGPYTVSSGDEGGPLTSGSTQVGSVPPGDLDPWTFMATANDEISVSIGEVLGTGPDPGFNPWIRLRGPDGTLVGDNSGTNAAQINARAPLTGAYTVLVAGMDSWNSQTAPGRYTLTVSTASHLRVPSGIE